MISDSLDSRNQPEIDGIKLPPWPSMAHLEKVLIQTVPDTATRCLLILEIDQYAMAYAVWSREATIAALKGKGLL